MKRYILIALICLSATSCTLAEKTTGRIYPKPSLLLNYNYFNDRGEETSSEEMQ